MKLKYCMFKPKFLLCHMTHTMLPLVQDMHSIRIQIDMLQAISKSTSFPDIDHRPLVYVTVALNLRSIWPYSGILALDTIVFAFVASRYKYKEIQHVPVHPPSGAIVIKKPPACPRHHAEDASTSEEASTSDDMDACDIYGRSIAFRAGTPNLPPELR